MRRQLIAGGLSAVASVALATPALAEGNWTSYWTRVIPGATSRTWTDNNGDSANTYTKYRLCVYYTGSPYTLRNIKATLYYNNTFTPDENMGTVSYYCTNSTWLQYNYGRVKAGDYFNKLSNAYDINGNQPPSYLNVGNSSSHGIAVNY